MKKTAIYLFMLIAAGAGIASCKFAKKTDETPTRGHTSILVDETFFPMIEGQVEVFESQYQHATLDIITLPEQDIAQLLAQDSTRIAILSRELTATEQAYFESKQIRPRVTDIAYDAIALIVSKQQRDTSITLAELKALLTGGENPHKYTLVFDNSRSSTVQYMLNLAGVASFANAAIYSANSSEELIKYISEHPAAIGFVGIDWLYEHDSDQQPYINKIQVLAVGTETGYYKPTQNDIASGEYPFIRKIRIINYQGTTGLGMGFASFLAGDVGQRIILKAGLVPVTYPKREILIRKKL